MAHRPFATATIRGKSVYVSRAGALFTAGLQRLVTPADATDRAEYIDAKVETREETVVSLRESEPEIRVFKGATYVRGADGQWHLMKIHSVVPVEEPPAAATPANGAAHRVSESIPEPAAVIAAPARVETPEPAEASAPMEAAENVAAGAADHADLGGANREAFESADISDSSDSSERQGKPVVRVFKGLTYERGADGQWHRLKTQIIVPVEETAAAAEPVPAPVPVVNGAAISAHEVSAAPEPASTAPAFAVAPVIEESSAPTEVPASVSGNGTYLTGLGDVNQEMLEGASAANQEVEPETRIHRGAVYVKGADGQWYRQKAQAIAPFEEEAAVAAESASEPVGNGAVLAAAEIPAAPEPVSAAAAYAEIPAAEAIPAPEEAPATATATATESTEIVDAKVEAPEAVETAAVSHLNETPATRIHRGATYVKGADGQWHRQRTRAIVPVEEKTPVAASPAPVSMVEDEAPGAVEIPAEPEPVSAVPAYAATVMSDLEPATAMSSSSAPAGAVDRTEFEDAKPTAVERTGGFIQPDEPETRTHKGAVYVRGADGQWHLQKTQTVVPVKDEEMPDKDVPAHAQTVYEGAFSATEFSIEPPEPVTAAAAQSETPALEMESAARKAPSKAPASVPPLAVPLAATQDERFQAEALARRYHAEFVDLKNFKIQHDLLRTVPVELMFRYNFVPIEQHQDALVIAVSDPSRLMVLDEIAGLLGQRIVARVATLSQITDLLKKTEQSQRVLDEASEGLTFDVLTGEENSDENISIEKLTSEEDISPIIRLVDTTIFTALERRASDIHFETNDDSVNVKYRIDGVLQPAMAPIAREHHTTILSRIKIMSELDIAERRVPQDGRFRVRYKNRLIDFRVSIMPTVHGENAVLRVLDKESMSEKFHHLTLDVVGFAEEDLRRFRRYIREPYGMVLVTGPTGSGKTTTLYAALNEIKSDEDKIITIEDPVEYQIRGITQIPVNEKKGLTFARGLRSILRHDPDKILVGEIRDQETAQIAINSALTGHLVFTTVHANNVVDVLGRFLNMGVEAYNFVSALNCILAQRLVRTVCEHCARPIAVSDEEMVASGMNPDDWRDVVFREGVGCIECGGTGYRGRTAIHELLDLTDPIRELILEKKPTSEVRKLAKKEGMSFLRESALDRVRKGLTTLKEINKVTFIEDDIEKASSPLPPTSVSSTEAAPVEEANESPRALPLASSRSSIEAAPILEDRAPARSLPAANPGRPAEAPYVREENGRPRPLPTSSPERLVNQLTYIEEEKRTVRPLPVPRVRKSAKVAFIKDGKKKATPLPAPRSRRST